MMVQSRDQGEYEHQQEPLNGGDGQQTGYKTDKDITGA